MFRLSQALLAAGFLVASLSVHADGKKNPDTNASLVSPAIPALERYVRALQQREEIPGIAVVIADRQRILYAKGFGVRELGKPAPVTPDTVFQIGSATKSFLATTVALAVDAGKLKWNTPLVERHPSFQLQDPWLTQQATLHPTSISMAVCSV